MKKYERICVDPEFAKKLRIKTVENGFKSMIEYTKQVADEERSMLERAEERIRPKKQKGSFLEGFEF